MKKTVILLVILMSFLFILGGILTWMDYVEVSDYAIAAGVTGSMASVIGLISLTSRTLTKTDVQDVGADILADLAENAKQLEELEIKIDKSVREVDEAQLRKQNLELQEKRLELIVRRAGAKLFIDDQIRRTAMEITSHVESDRRLSDLLEHYKNYRQEASSIAAEIAESEDANVINSIMEDVARERREIIIDILGIRIEILGAATRSGSLVRNMISSLQMLARTLP